MQGHHPDFDDELSEPAAAFAIVGLGVMGRSLAENLHAQNLPVIAYSYSEAERVDVRERFPNLRVNETLSGLVGELTTPRVVFLMVTAGEAVDQVLSDLRPLLEPGDVVIDGGNSHFQDSQRRSASLADAGLVFMGTGVSGGEEGARTGASVMVGGARAGFERAETLFNAISCEARGEPCYGWMGEGGAAHFVKMVHNGIEYGIMQLIAEAYDFLRRGVGLETAQIHRWFEAHRAGPLSSYLMDITTQILATPDDLGGGLLLDKIADRAGQKGTGRWTVDAAMELGVAVPAITAAVTQRQISAMVGERQTGERVLREMVAPVALDSWGEDLASALLSAVMATYAQGLQLIEAASNEYEWGTDVCAAVRLWRGGCIIRARVLDEIIDALLQEGAQTNLLLSSAIAPSILDLLPACRRVVGGAIAGGVPAPALSGCLAYIDSLRSARLPTNLIQAQRDFFGAHTYQRVDRAGAFHTQWGDELS